VLATSDQTQLISQEEVLRELLEEFPAYSREQIRAGLASRRWEHESSFAFLPRWLPPALNDRLLGLPYRAWKGIARGPMRHPLGRYLAAPLYIPCYLLATWLGTVRTFQSEEDLEAVYRNISEEANLINLAGFNYLYEGARLYQIYPHVDPLVPAASRVLDFGAGIAAFSLELARLKGCDVTLLDVPGRTQTFALNRFRSRGLPVHSLSPEQFADDQHQYDVVICFDVLEHLLEPVKILRQITSRLPSGGLLLLNLPTMGAGYGHIKEAKHDWLRSGGEAVLAREYSLLSQHMTSYRFFRKI
jgi:hypothetical protein